MRVTMLENRPVTVDGVNTIDCEAGESYEMGDGVAASLIEAGAAKAADELAADAPSRKGRKAKGDAPENKDGGAADAGDSADAAASEA